MEGCPLLTATPRVIHACRDRAARLRDRGPAKTSGRSLVCLGAGLALAGTGAATAAGLLAAPANAAGPAGSLRKPTEAVATSPLRGRTAGHQGMHVTARQTKAATAKRGRLDSRVVARGHAAAHVAAQWHAKHAKTWLAIERTVAGRTIPAPPPPGHGPLPAQDRLTPTGTSGPQEWMAITPARYANAATIVHQAIDKKMGLRSAVIAVATAMAESTLLNINYGDRDSLGLFQQRPSCGWGTASQLLRPAYAADAFLSGLHSYEASNPAWAHEPVWQPAQGVQASGFPYAYAKWEAQAAHLVGSVARHLV